MADDTTREDLVQLRAELAAQRSEFAAFRARAAVGPCPRPHLRLPRRFLPFALVALLVLLTPLSLLAAAPFNDLTGGVHDPNIGLIYDAGITKGCVPNISYCPTGNVTREEMATFLARTAGLGNNPPVVNAKTAQSATVAGAATNASHASTADTASNAGQLNGHSADYYQAANQPIANATHANNADLVGGYAPSGLERIAQQTAYPYPTYLNLTPTYATVATVVIAAPGPGFLLVTGAAGINVSQGEGDLRVRDSGPGGLTAPYAFESSPGTLTTNFVFPVASAGTQTVVLEARNVQPGNSNPIATNATITAVFVPFGYNGGTSLAP